MIRKSHTQRLKEARSLTVPNRLETNNRARDYILIIFTKQFLTVINKSVTVQIEKA